MKDLANGTKVRYTVCDEDGFSRGIIRHDTEGRMYIQDLEEGQVSYYPCGKDEIIELQEDI